MKDNFSLRNRINLYPENFSLPIKYNFGQPVRDDRAELAVNSQILDINSMGNSVIVSYRSGIPYEEFNGKVMANLPELFRKFMKYYLIYIKNGRKVSHDIELPFSCTGIGFYKSDDFILLNTNPAITETETESVFYIAKLEK